MNDHLIQAIDYIAVWDCSNNIVSLTFAQNGFHTNMNIAVADGPCKLVLHVALPSPLPRRSPSKFVIVPMATVLLTHRMDTMLNFHGKFHGNGEGDTTCNQTFIKRHKPHAFESNLQKLKAPKEHATETSSAITKLTCSQQVPLHGTYIQKRMETFKTVYATNHWFMWQCVQQIISAS